MSQFPLLTACQNLLEGGNVPTDILESKLGNLPNDEIIMNYLLLVGAVYRKNIRRFQDSKWGSEAVKYVNLRKRTITFKDDDEISADDFAIEPEMMQVYVRACLQIGVYEPPVEFFLLLRDDKPLANRRAKAFIEYLLRRDWKPNEHSMNSSQCIRDENVFRRISLGKGRVQPAGRKGRNTRKELLEQLMSETPIDIADYRIIGHTFFQNAVTGEDPVAELRLLLEKDNFDRPVVEAFTKNEFLVSWFRANLRHRSINTMTNHTLGTTSSTTTTTTASRFQESTQKHVYTVTRSKHNNTYFDVIQDADDRICGLLALMQSYQNLVLPTAKFFRSGDDALVEQPFDVLEGFGQQHRFKNEDLKTVVDKNGFTVVKDQLGKSFGEPLRKVDFHELTFTFRQSTLELEAFPPQPLLGSSGIMHTASPLGNYLPYDFLLEHGVTLFGNEPRDTLQLLKTYRSYIFAKVPFNDRRDDTEDQFFLKYYKVIMSLLDKYDVHVDDQLLFEPFEDSFASFKMYFSLEDDYSLGMFYRTAWWNNQVCKLRSLFSIAAWVGDRLHDLLAWIDPDYVPDRKHYFITPLCSVFLLNDLKQDPRSVYAPLHNVLYEIPGEVYELNKYIEMIRELAKKKDLNDLNELVKIATLFRVKEEPLPDEQLAFLQNILHPAYLKYLTRCFPAEFIGSMDVDHLLSGAFTLSHPTDPLWFMSMNFAGARSKNMMDNVYALRYIVDSQRTPFEKSAELHPMLFNAVKLYFEAIDDPSFKYNFVLALDNDDSFSGVTVDEAVREPHKVDLNPFYAYTNVDKETAFLDQVTRNIERLHEDNTSALRDHLYVHILDPDRQRDISRQNTHPFDVQHRLLSERGFIASTNGGKIDFPNNIIMAIPIPVTPDLYIQHFSKDKKTLPWPDLLHSSSIINFYNDQMKNPSDGSHGFFKGDTDEKLKLPSFKGIKTVNFIVGPPPPVVQGTLHINCEFLSNFVTCDLLAEELYTVSLQNTIDHDTGIEVTGTGHTASYMAAVFAARAYNHVKKVTLTDPVPTFQYYLRTQDEVRPSSYDVTFRTNTIDRLHDYILGRRYGEKASGSPERVLVEIHVKNPPPLPQTNCIVSTFPALQRCSTQTDEHLPKMFNKWIMENNLQQLAIVNGMDELSLISSSSSPPANVPPQESNVPWQESNVPWQEHLSRLLRDQ